MPVFLLPKNKSSLPKITSLPPNMNSAVRSVARYSLANKRYRYLPPQTAFEKYLNLNLKKIKVFAEVLEVFAFKYF